MIKKLNNRYFFEIILLLIVIVLLCTINIVNIINNKKLQLNIDNLYNSCEQESYYINQKIEDINETIDDVKSSYVEYEIEDDENEDEDLENNDTQTNRWNIALTTEEIDLLAKIVYLESGNQCLEGQMAVVEVIFNRMLKYDETLEEVLSKPGQFTTWKNRNMATATTSVYEAIFRVIYGQSDILPFKTLYFSRGSGGREIQVKIEDHVFCN